MNRFKITRASVESAQKFLSGKEKTGPSWAKKYKDDLVVKKGKVLYKGLPVVATEDVHDLLRKEIFKKDSDIPPSRDACFHLCKQRYAGISRRNVMKFLMAQKTLGQNRAAMPKAKQAAGEKLKKYIFECDLVFVKRNDVEKADAKFKRLSKKKLPELSYMVTTCEKITGITRVNRVDTKDAKVVTPIIMRQIREMCKQLKVDPKACGLRSDKGGEMDHKVLGTLVGSTEHVRLGPHIENKNRQIQSQFYRILRAKKSKTIEDAMQKSEVLINQTYNKIHKQTPNEAVENKLEDNKKVYNKSRKQHISTTKRELQVGDHVRILIKDKKTGLDFKSYKDMTYSTQLYVVKRKTKKAVPPKYWVNKKWRLVESLLKTEPRDEKTDELILTREVKDDEDEKSADVKHEKKRDKEVAADNKRKDAEVAQGRRMRTRETHQAYGRHLTKDVLKYEKTGVEDEIKVQRKDEDGKEREKKRDVIRKKLVAKKKHKLADWTLQRLQSFAKVRNISVSGTKARLKARIRMYILNKRKNKN